MQIMADNKTDFSDFNWGFTTLERLTRAKNIILRVDMPQKCCSIEDFIL